MTIRCDARSDYPLCHQCVSNKVAADFNMLHLLMKNKIINIIHNYLIVTIHHHWLVVNDAQFRKKRLNPHQFTGCMNHGSILNLNNESGNDNIFFTSSCHQIVSNKVQ